MQLKTKFLVGLSVSLCLAATPSLTAFTLIDLQVQASILAQLAARISACQQTKDTQVQTLRAEVEAGMIGVLEWHLDDCFSLDLTSADAAAQIEAKTAIALSAIGLWEDYYNSRYAVIEAEFANCVGTDQTQSE